MSFNSEDYRIKDKHHHQNDEDYIMTRTERRSSIEGAIC
jgi:hypothetical protein